MEIYEAEEKVLQRYEDDMFQAKDSDTINKLYRQARIWNRFHHFFAEACTYERYKMFQYIFIIARDILWH